MIYEVECGDLRRVLATLPENCIDSCPTDPPYELGFMGKAWDSTGIAFDPEAWRAVWRVLKPGAYVAAFGGTRTWHRIACAIEDAGFEVRDSLAWLYGQGFPKSQNVERAVATATCELPGRHFVGKLPKGKKAQPGDHTCPPTAQSLEHKGEGSALKPSFEPIILARKPLIGTMADNVLQFGVGSLHIDACRVAHSSPEDLAQHAAGVAAIKARGGSMEGSWKNSSDLSGASDVTDAGRWPPNVACDEAVAREIDERFGTRKAGIAVQRNGGGGAIFNKGGFEEPRADSGYADSGGASRYFYCPKANGKERDAGLEAAGWPALTGGDMTDRDEGAPGATNPRSGAGRGGGRWNPHPTVKPLELMRWLVRLITPPGGFVLDPFAGSGTTGCAAVLEGFRFAGCELSEVHTKLAMDRIGYWARQRAA